MTPPNSIVFIWSLIQFEAITAIQFNVKTETHVISRGKHCSSRIAVLRCKPRTGNGTGMKHQTKARGKGSKAMSTPEFFSVYYKYSRPTSCRVRRKASLREGRVITFNHISSSKTVQLSLTTF